MPNQQLTTHFTMNNKAVDKNSEKSTTKTTRKPRPKRDMLAEKYAKLLRKEAKLIEQQLALSIKQGEVNKEEMKLLHERIARREEARKMQEAAVKNSNAFKI